MNPTSDMTVTIVCPVCDAPAGEGCRTTSHGDPCPIHSDRYRIYHYLDQHYPDAIEPVIDAEIVDDDEAPLPDEDRPTYVVWEGKHGIGAMLGGVHGFRVSTSTLQLDDMKLDEIQRLTALGRGSQRAGFVPTPKGA